MAARHADAATQAHGAAGERELAGQRLADALGDPDRDRGPRDVVEHDQELVAPKTSDQVRVAAGQAQALGDQHEQLVAGRVAEAVVDGLELVEVHVHGADARRALAREASR